MKIKLTKTELAGKNLKLFRQSNSLTQEELGKILNLAANTVCKYENEGIGNLDVIENINKILAVDLLSNEFVVNKINEDMNDKIKTFNINLKKNNLEFMDLIKIQELFRECVIQKKELKSFVKFFSWYKNNLSDPEKIELVENAYNILLTLPSNITENPYPLNDLYQKTVIMIQNIFLEIYRKIYFGLEDHETISIDTMVPPLIQFSTIYKCDDNTYELEPYLGFGNFTDREVKKMIKDILPDNLDEYDRSTANLLLKSIIFFIQGTYRLNWEKTLDTVIFLLKKANIKENDIYEFSNLEEIIYKKENEKYHQTIQNYEAYKVAPIKQRKKIIVICLNACIEYSSKESESEEERTFFLNVERILMNIKKDSNSLGIVPNLLRCKNFTYNIIFAKDKNEIVSYMNDNKDSYIFG